MTYTLTDHERAVLSELRKTGAEPMARRADIILLSAEGAQTGAIAAAVTLSTSQVRYWRRRWREERLDIFAAAQADTDLHEAAGKAEAAPVLAVAAPATTAIVVVNAAAEPAGEEMTDEDIEPGVASPRRPLVLSQKIGVEPSDPMAEAGRKALLFHFERMLLNEPGSRLGADIEAVHDMRVATRRMRSALRIFGPYFDPLALQPFNASLRRTAGLLGVVRDLDVFVEKAQQFARTHPGTNLTPVYELWDDKRRAARETLIGYLDSTDFAKFVRRFDKFLNKPGKGRLPLPDPSEGIAFQVRHLAPGLIYDRYERVRVFETGLETATIEQLHALRIEFKRFRYALEFFTDALGPESRAVISACKVMQDHLGDLHDAEVAVADLSAFVYAHNVEFSGVPKFIRPDISGVEAYVAAKRAEKEHLLVTFPEAWAAFTSADVRRSLALAVAVL